MTEDELRAAEDILLDILHESPDIDVDDLIQRARAHARWLSSGAIMSVVWSLVGSGRARYTPENALEAVA